MVALTQAYGVMVIQDFFLQLVIILPHMAIVYFPTYCSHFGQISVDFF